MNTGNKQQNNHEKALAWLSMGDTGPLTTQERVASLFDQLDVYRLALAFACGEEEWPGTGWGKESTEILAVAQNEIRHGRTPEWLSEDWAEPNGPEIVAVNADLWAAIRFLIQGMAIMGSVRVTHRSLHEQVVEIARLIDKQEAANGQ